MSRNCLSARSLFAMQFYCLALFLNVVINVLLVTMSGFFRHADQLVTRPYPATLLWTMSDPTAGRSRTYVEPAAVLPTTWTFTAPMVNMLSKSITYSRRTLFRLRLHSKGPSVDSTSKTICASLAQHGLLRFRGTRAGQHRPCPIHCVVTQRRQYPLRAYDYNIDRPHTLLQAVPASTRVRTLVSISCSAPCPLPPPPLPTKTSSQRFSTPPTLYVINTTSLAKPHALQQLHVDVLTAGAETRYYYYYYRYC